MLSRWRGGPGAGRTPPWLAVLLWVASWPWFPLFATPIGTHQIQVDSLLELRPKIVDLPPPGAALVVPPLATGTPARDPRIGADLLRLRMLDANLWLLPRPWASERQERLECFFAMVASWQPDIVTLQEVWLNPDLGRIRRALPEYWAAGVPPFVFNRGGLVVFSRFPIREARHAFYPLTKQHSFVETLAQKGFLQVDIEVGGRLVRVIDTHLYASPSSSSNRFPVWQFEILRRLTAEVELPTIVAGDLNIRQDSLFELNAGHFTTETMHGPPEERGTTVRQPHRKIDFILGRSPENVGMLIESRTLRDPVVSDHIPVLGEITIRFGPEKP